MEINRLKTAVALLLREASVEESEIPSKEKVLAGFPRITWDRQVGRYRHYVHFTPLRDDFLGQYGVLYGQWVGDANGGFGVSDPEQFDSRSLGDLDYCVSFLRAWLVETRDWRSLPPMRAGGASGGSP